MITFFIVLAIIVGVLAYIGLAVFVMDMFDSGRWLSGVIASAAMIIVTAAIIAFFIDATNPPGGQPAHGSCKYEHWAGKLYICDEYYPLPQRGD